MRQPASLNPVALLGNGARSLGTLPTGEDVVHLPRWGKVSDVKRLKIIRKLINGYQRDPRIRTMALGIISRAGVPARDYLGQANAILRWARATVPYVNEPGELLQSPFYSLGLDRSGQQVRPPSADCDDFAILIGSLLGSIRLETRLVLSGTHPRGGRVRFVEKQGRPQRGVRWSHVYIMVGTPAFSPTTWTFMEPTLNVPIGWEVVKDGQRGVLPELAGTYGASAWGEESLDPTDDARAEREQRRLAAVEWVKSLPWVEIVAGTLPMVLSAILIDRYFKRGK